MQDMKKLASNLRDFARRIASGLSEPPKVETSVLAVERLKEEVRAIDGELQALPKGEGSEPQRRELSARAEELVAERDALRTEGQEQPTRYRIG